MDTLYRENLIKDFDVSALVDYLEKNNKLIAEFLIKNNYDNFPTQIFELLLRETELLKKVCENIENMLEQGLLIDDENIQNFRNRIKETGLDFFMSGSGSCYYILSSKNTTDDCRIIKCNFL